MNKNEMLESIKQKGSLLAHASEKLKNDKEVVLEAVKQDGLALVYASEELKNDKEVFLAAVKQNKLLLKYLNKKSTEYKELLYILIEYEMFKVMKEKLEINSKKKNSLRKKYNNNCERGD